MMAPPPVADPRCSTGTARFEAATDADAAVEGFVRRALRDDVLVPDESIEVSVRDRVVRLHGLINSAAQRREAGRVAARVTGVLGVDNRLQVGGPPLEVDRIRRAVEDLLIRHARREAAALEIRLDGDVVRISGTLPSWGRRSAVERFVSSMPQVRRVDDRTVVDPLA